MNVYINKTFTGHYPVGTSAIVVAPNAECAALDLQLVLESAGLKQSVEPCDMILVNDKFPHVTILNDGDY